MLETSGLYYPNRFARLFLLAMEEVMGKHGLSTILDIAGLDSYFENPPPDNLARQFDFASMSAIGQALEDMYGARGGRGIALRIGRATFSMGIKNFGMMSGMADPAFQRLPLERRTRLGLQALAAVFNNFTDQHCDVEEQETTYQFIVDNSPLAWGRTTDRPVCHWLAGIIQEALRWSSQGYEFHVQEMACRATGSENCVFRVNKNPIGGGSLG